MTPMVNRKPFRQPREDWCSALAPAWLHPATWKAIWEREDGSCLCCCRDLNRETGASAHHLRPRSMGGSKDIQNLVLLCEACHDRLEQAQEAMLAVRQMPPSVSQLSGIFVPLYATQNKRGKGLMEILPQRKRDHALRILGHCRNAKVLCLMALREHRWPHVDWKYVARGLGIEGKVLGAYQDEIDDSEGFYAAPDVTTAVSGGLSR